MTTAIPPTIPGTSLFKTMQVDTAKITEIVGDVVADFSSWKGTVKAASTANLTLSGAQTVDTVAVVAGDLVLAKNQSTATQNGVYVVYNGAWVRVQNLPTGASASGAAVYVSSGVANGGRAFICTNAVGSDVVDTANLTFIVFVNALTSAKAGTTTLVSGTKVINTLVSLDTGDRIFVSRRSKGSSTAIGSLAAAVTATGAAGTASFTITALTGADGTTTTGDLSVVDWMVVSSAAFT